MEDQGTDLLHQHPQIRATLLAYLGFSPSLGSGEKWDGWVSRLPSIPDVPSDQLSSVHGKMIAHGLLRFDVGDRHTGIRYQVTPEGRQLVSGGLKVAAETTDCATSAA